MKKVLVAMVAGAIVAGALFFVFNLGSIVARAIEQHGSSVTGTPVAVSGVDLSLREGSGTIRGLAVGSPDGFDTKEALSFDDIAITLNVEESSRELIVLDEVRIAAPTVRVELSPTGKTNLDEIRRRVQEFAAEANLEDERVRIRSLVFQAGSIEVDASAVGLEPRTLNLPELRLQDVGGSSGAGPEEIAKIVLGAVVGRATSQIAGSEVENLIRGQLGDAVGDAARGLLDKIGG